MIIKTKSPDKGFYSQIISILAIIIAGCAAFTLPFESDNASFVLGTLTLLVTLLVGWQIYSAIDVKSQISKAAKVTEELERVKKKIEIESKSAIFVSLAQLGRSAFNKVKCIMLMGERNGYSFDKGSIQLLHNQIANPNQ